MIFIENNILCVKRWSNEDELKKNFGEKIYYVRKNSLNDLLKENIDIDKSIVGIYNIKDDPNIYSVINYKKFIDYGIKEIN